VIILTNRSKQKGTSEESRAVRYFRRVFNDIEHTIDRLTLHGNKDVGDIGGIYINGEKCVVEVKNCKRMELSKWVKEAQIEAGNADAPNYIVVHHRAGIGEANYGQTFVTTTLEQFCKWCGGDTDAAKEA
jgi:hypothetical protein